MQVTIGAAAKDQSEKDVSSDDEEIQNLTPLQETIIRFYDNKKDETEKASDIKPSVATESKACSGKSNLVSGIVGVTADNKRENNNCKEIENSSLLLSEGIVHSKNGGADTTTDNCNSNMFADLRSEPALSQSDRDLLADNNTESQTIDYDHLDTCVDVDKKQRELDKISKTCKSEDENTFFTPATPCGTAVKQECLDTVTVDCTLSPEKKCGASTKNAIIISDSDEDVIARACERKSKNKVKKLHSEVTEHNRAELKHDKQKEREKRKLKELRQMNNTKHTDSSNKEFSSKSQRDKTSGAVVKHKCESVDVVSSKKIKKEKVIAKGGREIKAKIPLLTDVNFFDGSKKAKTVTEKSSKVKVSEDVHVSIKKRSKDSSKLKLKDSQNHKRAKLESGSKGSGHSSKTAKKYVVGHYNSDIEDSDPELGCVVLDGASSSAVEIEDSDDDLELRELFEDCTHSKVSKKTGLSREMSHNQDGTTLRHSSKAKEHGKASGSDKRSLPSTSTIATEMLGLGKKHRVAHESNQVS